MAFSRHNLPKLWRCSLLYAVVVLLIPSSESSTPGLNRTAPQCTLSLLTSDVVESKPKCTVLLEEFADFRGYCKFVVEGNESPAGLSVIAACNDYIRCDGLLAIITMGWSTSGLKHRIQMNCSADYPLDVNVNQQLPFGGIQVSFGRYQESPNSTLYWVQTTIPQTPKLRNEFLDTYSGNYSFYASDNNPELITTISLDIHKASVLHNGSESSTRIVNTEPPINNMCLRIFENRVDCYANYSKTELYLVNVGGENPTHTRLLTPCLDTNLNHTCGNKIPGTNCGTNRYCKKLVKVHSNGILRCTSDRESKDLQYFRDLDTSIQTNVSKMWDDYLIVRIEIEDFLSTLSVGHRNKYHFYRKRKGQNASAEHQQITSMLEPFDPEKCPRIPMVPIQTNYEDKVYDKDVLYFECHFLPYLLIPPVIWTVRFKNGTSRHLLTDYGDNITDEHKILRRHQDSVMTDIKSSHIRLEVELEMKTVSCQVGYWNSPKYAVSDYNVTVLESSIPIFFEKEVHHMEMNETLTLECKANVSQPPAFYTWLKNGKRVPGKNYNATTGIYQDNVGKQDGGKYTCVASNFLGKAQKDFHVTIHSVVDRSWIWFGIASLTCIVLIIIFSVISFKMYNIYLAQRTRLSYLEIKEFIQGNQKELKDNKLAHENAQFMPYNKNYDILWKEFRLEEKELGKGAHGIVYKGRIGKMPIAVKTLRPGVDKAIFKALLSEVKIMIHLGKHDCIVDLKGACTEFLNEGRAYVLAEYCPLGNLEQFLRDNRSTFGNRNRSAVQYQNNGSSSEASVYFTVRDLIRWCTQVARGMQHLESKKVVHGDLATRNILLASMHQVKITDFGLSRQLVNCDAYVKTQQELLPWRWMAIESLRHFIFTSKSDVWSFGVTLWEIFTLGQIPYPGMTWTMDFLQNLEDNLRLSKPKHADEAIYNILKRCWAPEPEQRPNFMELENLLFGCELNSSFSV